MGVNELYNNEMIFCAGFSESDIMTDFPFPLLAHPSIRDCDAPLPIPIV